MCIVDGLEEQASAASDREQSLRDKLATLKNQVALSNQDNVRLAALQREVASVGVRRASAA